MAKTTIEFIEELVGKYPQLMPFYSEHCEDYEDVLPHVLFGDFSRYVIVQGSDLERNRPFLESFMFTMEQAISRNDERISNLVHVSFVENLMGEYELIDRLSGITSPAFLRLIKDITGYDLMPHPSRES